MDKKKAPSMATIAKWAMNGVAKATDGCTVEADGYCPHGKPSWVIVNGMI